jgi:aryl-alcohol dehydrogenase-like predicted oxidoreductase
MRYSELGRTGQMVSRVGLGTMMYGSQVTPADAHAQMDYALERGVNLFDTAEAYSVPPRPETQGRTEEIIGDWFKATGARDKVFLASKIAGNGSTFPNGMNWMRPDGGSPRVTGAQIDFAVDNSLRRLRTDRIDLYQIHWPDRDVNKWGTLLHVDYADDFQPFEAQLEALARHVEAGRIRYIGVSNETPWGVMRFIAAAEKFGLPRMASIQNAYGLVNRTFELGLSEIALQESVGLLAYSSLGQGYLTGKYQNGALPEGARKTLFQRLGRYEKVGAEAAIQSYLDLAASYGIDPAAFAYRFVDSKPFVTSTLIGASTMAQLKTDIDAFDLDWTAEMDAAVDALHNRQPNPCP